MAEAVVLGAGIIGAAVAYRLGRAGWRVTVLEAARPAARASCLSFAWFNIHATGYTGQHRWATSP